MSASITALETQHFRNLEDGAATFDRGVNLLVGPNGQGKTNLLEAVYVACFSKSFRTGSLGECVAHGRQGFRIRCRVARPGAHHVLEVLFSRGGKTVVVDGKPASVADLLHCVSVFCITADHLRIVADGAEERRRFFDSVSAILRPPFLQVLSDYRRVQRQKHALLQRGTPDAAAMDVWNRNLVRAARAVVDQRQWLAGLFNEGVPEALLSGTPLAIRYRPSLDPAFLATEEKAVEFLNLKLASEAAMKRCLYGPHLDRYEILLGGHSARQFASSGQKRGVVFSIYFRALELFRERRGEYPVVMVDDVDMELDPCRIGLLLEHLKGKAQLFLTTAKPLLLAPLLPEASCYRVEGGALREGPPA